MDFKELLAREDDKEDDPLQRQGRIRIPVDVLEERLAYYGEHTEGFETTDEHLEAMVQIFHEHRNVFLTGGAGTGKTSFTKTVIMPEMDYRNLNWSVTASTGIAGSHLDGKTVHSFFGIQGSLGWKPIYSSRVLDYIQGAVAGDDVPPPQEMTASEREGWYSYFLDRWKKDPSCPPHVRARMLSKMRSHEVLLIDELSMCHGCAMLGYLDYMLREVREDERPFGGMQIIGIGDFAQLPPVEKGYRPKKADWAFLAPIWRRAGFKTVELTRVFRQGDQKFIAFLNAVRMGREVDRGYVESFVRYDLPYEETKDATYLVTHVADADEQNIKALLQHYPAPTIPLTALPIIDSAVQHLKQWEVDDGAKVEKQLRRKLKNVRMSDAIPIRIGCPVMFSVNDKDGRFVNGTLGFVREVEIEDDDPAHHHLMIGVPVKGGDERMVKLYRYAWSREREQDPKATVLNESGQAISKFPTIRQFPITNATAITIHKSQGMSMDKVILSAAKSFAPGQVYVGLSRLRSPKGLILTDADFVARVDPDVMRFYRSLEEEREMANMVVPY